MIEKFLPNTHHSEETLRRSVIKTVGYRAIILILDFGFIYLFTGQIKVAVGFMIVSNIYTTLGYFFYERIWDRIKWGKIRFQKLNNNKEINEGIGYSRIGANKKILFIVFVSLQCLSGVAQQRWSLKACIDTAFKKNISLNQGKLTSQINKVNLVQSKAAFLPNLNLSDVHSLNSGYSLDPFTYLYTHQNITINTLSLTSTVTLFNGYLLVNTVKQNKLIYGASLYDVDKLKNDIILNVLAGFMQVLMDYEAIEIANSQVEETHIQVDQTQKFVDFGKVAELSLIQVQSQLAADRLTKINAENQLELDKVTLLQLMDTPVRADFDVERHELKELFPEIPMSTEEIERIAKEFLPQVKSATMKTSASIYSLKVAESGWLPKLVMGGTLKTGYSSLRTTSTVAQYNQETTVGYLNNNPTLPVINNSRFTVITSKKEPLANQLNDNLGQIVNLTLSVPIFNNLQVKSNIAIAKLNILNSRLNELQVKNDLRKSIETAYTNQVNAGKKLVATQEQMRLETRTYQDMEKKYAFGSMGATDFLIEKNNFNKVSMSLIQSKYDYVMKTKIVDFYSGKTLSF